MKWTTLGLGSVAVAHPREACGARDYKVLQPARSDGAAVPARAAVRRAGRRGGGEVSQCLAQRRRHLRTLVASRVTRVNRINQPGLWVTDDLLQPEHGPLAAQDNRAGNRRDARDLSSHTGEATAKAAPATASAAPPQLRVAVSSRLVEAVELNGCVASDVGDGGSRLPIRISPRIVCPSFDSPHMMEHNHRPRAQVWRCYRPCRYIDSGETQGVDQGQPAGVVSRITPLS